MSEITTQEKNQSFIFTANPSTKSNIALQAITLNENQLPFKNKEKKIKPNGLDRLRKLYPYTDLDELPLAWSNKEKANCITLSDNNLKVHYKAVGKGHKDAASVRAEKPIPQSCLLYYYEIKIVCKGRDGYMGIGLAAENVNLQRLPGWDKHSYGYHGDDGHSFSSSGTGKQYGPTFTTNNIIGCGFNIIENKCFYTKDGFSLGDAFEDLVNMPLYPTVGLQTPGEEIIANFGLEPFVFDIQQEIDRVRDKLTSTIINFPVKYNEWQYSINKIIQSWLVHNGYYNTAEVFSTSSKQDFKVNVNSVKQRHKIQQLVLTGKIGEAIELTNKYYPAVLKENPNLLFALKCRQFVEMINGFGLENLNSSTTNYLDHNNCVSNGNSAKIKGCSSMEGMEVDDDLDLVEQLATNSNNELINNEDGMDRTIMSKLNELNKNNYNQTQLTNNGSSNDKLEHRTKKTKNTSSSFNNNLNSLQTANNSTINNFIKKDNVISKLPKILEFGKDLHALNQQLAKEHGPNKDNEKMLCDAFSLIAYEDPSLSSISWQLDPAEREQVCLQLNNAIIKNLNQEGNGCCQTPPLEAIVKQTKSLLRQNNNYGAWLPIDRL